MGPSPDAQPLDEEVSDGEQAILDMVLALQRGDGKTALAVAPTALDGAITGPLKARVLGWWSQAARMAHNPTLANQKLDEALQIAREHDDQEGLEQLSSLRSQPPPQPGPPPETPVALAIQAMDAGDLAKGELLALGAHRLALRDNNSKDQVLALLALARLEHRQEQAFAQAAEVADASNDQNLITLVAKTMRSAGLTPKKHVF